ncbi:MAG: hypothetical protein IJX64_00010 [Clostridia bacterium]|nr:hypothetical protein [Clostridia bacterium]
MKKLFSMLLVVLLSAALCCISYAADAEYSLNDVLSAMDLMRQKSPSYTQRIAYDANGDGDLHLDDVLSMIAYCQKNSKPSDCAFSGRTDHDCVVDDIKPGQYADLTYTSSTYKIDMNYRVRVPKNYSPDGEYALVVFLHGLGGESQSISQLGGGALFTNILRSDYGNDTILLVPQCPKGMTWPDNRKTVEVAYELIDMLASHLAIDRDRMYLSGHSNGAKGVAYMIDSHPYVFAAAILSAGASPIGNYKNFEGMAATPMRMYCSNDDPYKFYTHMKSLAVALQYKGGDAVYKEYNGLGHGIFTTVSNESGLIDWMYEQTRANTEK